MAGFPTCKDITELTDLSPPKKICSVL
ncbi:hypothetical protein N4627_06950 [Limosilactobacillus vaginalis]|nr:hypothetical protein [Limosilactobacillus vaginalis]UXC70107.1 hypothetical protein N4627_06950 [Limosilactobacillus vaginalis]